MKHVFTFAILVLAVFAAGVGIGSLMSLQLPVSTTAMNLETSTASSRALSYNQVQAGTSTPTEPLKAVAKTQDLEGPQERPSPSNWIKENAITMGADGVSFKLNNPQWAILANTNSMDPVFDEGAHLIQEVPASQDQIGIGDIISYNSPLGFSIVHRVIEIGNDESGWYAITKGDNNPTSDPWKIRWDMVTRVTVAIIY